MAFVHGKDTVFKLDNSAGTLTDLSAYITSSGLPREVDTHDVTVYGKSAKVYIAGLSDATIPLEGKWDATLDAHMNGIVGGVSRSWEWGPEGSASGKVKYSGECLLTSYESNAPVDGEVTWSGEMQVTDTITRGTWP